VATSIFQARIAILGGIRVLNGRDLLTIVGQGGSGYFFEQAAEKACVIDSAVDSPVVRKHGGAGP
jgi:hypothetical protein